RICYPISSFRCYVDIQDLHSFPTRRSSDLMTAEEKEIKFEIPVNGHRAAVGLLLNQLMEQHIIQSYQAIDAVGHRVAHGGEYFRSEEHTSELQSRFDLVCRLLLEKKN